jgi:hypothetical protein
MNIKKISLFFIMVLVVIGGVFGQSNTNTPSGDDKTAQRIWFDAKTGNQCFSLNGVTCSIAMDNAGYTIIVNHNNYRVTVVYTTEDGKRTGVVTLEPKGQTGEKYTVRGVVSLKQSVPE